MRQHWFFDFDGTLCDTEADIKSAWRAALRNLGRDCPHFDSVYRTGPTLDQVVRGNPRRRRMQNADCELERGHPQSLDERFRKRFRKIGVAQRILDRLSQRRLR